MTKRPAGSSLVLRCRYHGWTYDSKGKLLKAPQFDDIDGFDKSENSLFSIHTCMDRTGFVYINLDAKQDIHPPDLNGLQNFVLEAGLEAGNKWLTGWSLSGAFNWKVFSSQDCQTEIGASTPSSLIFLLSSVFYNLLQTPYFSTSNCKTVASLPGTVVFTFAPSPIWATATALPVSATTTMLQFDIFSAIDMPLVQSTTDHLKVFFGAYVQRLEQRYERLKLERWEGEMKQVGVLKEHRRMEREVGREILPARPRPEKGESEAFCRAEQGK